MNKIIIDAQTEPAGIPAPFFLMNFDPQGQIEWEPAVFASLYVPELFDGLKTLETLKKLERRPLNGRVASALSRQQAYIPDAWKPFRVLFMGETVGICGDENYISLELRYSNDGRVWVLEHFNFSANRLKENHRIPLLPK